MRVKRDIAVQVGGGLCLGRVARVQGCPVVELDQSLTTRWLFDNGLPLFEGRDVLSHLQPRHVVFVFAKGGSINVLHIPLEVGISCLTHENVGTRSKHIFVHLRETLGEEHGNESHFPAPYGERMERGKQFFKPLPAQVVAPFAYLWQPVRRFVQPYKEGNAQVRG